jgi:hypothetical protein
MVYQASCRGGLDVVQLGGGCLVTTPAYELGYTQGDHASQGCQDTDHHQQLDEGKACLSIPKRITHCSH